MFRNKGIPTESLVWRHSGMPFSHSQEAVMWLDRAVTPGESRRLPLEMLRVEFWLAEAVGVVKETGRESTLF